MQKTGNFYITQYAIRSQSLKHVFEAVWEKKKYQKPHTRKWNTKSTYISAI